MNFLDEYLLTEEPDLSNTSDWRERKVYHRTPVTRQWKRVKIKSLPPSEQKRYAPLALKLKWKKAGTYIPKNPNQGVPLTSDRVFTVYYSGDRKGGYNVFEKGKFVVGTDDSAKAIQMEKDGHTVAIATGVPLDAFKKYYDYKNKKWVEFDRDMDSEKKYEMIEFTDNDLFLVDFFAYKDKMRKIYQ
jgi:hypothetical protein